MTWSEWVESNFNNSNYIIYNNSITNDGGKCYLRYTNINYQFKISNTIDENGNYTTTCQSPVGGSN